jgi:hypothetical protein
MDEWMVGGWVDTSKSGFIDNLQQSKIFSFGNVKKLFVEFRQDFFTKKMKNK